MLSGAAADCHRDTNRHLVFQEGIELLKDRQARAAAPFLVLSLSRPVTERHLFNWPVGCWPGFTFGERGAPNQALQRLTEAAEKAWS